MYIHSRKGVRQLVVMCRIELQCVILFVSVM